MEAAKILVTFNLSPSIQTDSMFLRNFHFLSVIDKWTLHHLIIIPLLNPLQSCSQVYLHTISLVSETKLWCTKRFLRNLKIKIKKHKIINFQYTETGQVSLWESRTTNWYFLFLFLLFFFFSSISLFRDLWHLLLKSILINICKAFILPTWTFVMFCSIKPLITHSMQG